VTTPLRWIGYCRAASLEERLCASRAVVIVGSWPAGCSAVAQLVAARQPQRKTSGMAKAVAGNWSRTDRRIASGGTVPRCRAVLLPRLGISPQHATEAIVSNLKLRAFHPRVCFQSNQNRKNTIGSAETVVYTPRQYYAQFSATYGTKVLYTRIL